jgi:hypothetical protein
MGVHAAAEDHGLGSLADLAETAAAETGELSAVKLQRWIASHAGPRLTQALPVDEYERLSRELHRSDVD